MTLRIDDIKVGDVLVPKTIKEFLWDEHCRGLYLDDQDHLLRLPSCRVYNVSEDYVILPDGIGYHVSRFSHIARQDPDLGSWTVTEVDQVEKSITYTYEPPCCTCPSLLNGHSPGCGWHVAPETMNVWGIPQPKPEPSYKTESDGV